MGRDGELSEALTAYEVALSHFDWADEDLRDAAALEVTAAEYRLNALLVKRRAERSSAMEYVPIGGFMLKV